MVREGEDDQISNSDEETIEGVSQKWQTNMTEQTLIRNRVKRRCTCMRETD